MIKEFDLDSPGLSKDERSCFRYQTRSLTNLFEQLLRGKLQCGSAWKILVEVVPAVSIPKPRLLLGVLAIQITGEPLKVLLAGGNIEKQTLAMDWLTSGIKKVAAEFGFEERLVDEAAEQARKVNFKNDQTWIKPKKSPAGDVLARISVERDAYEARIIARFSTLVGTSVSEVVLSVEKPDEFIFASKIGHLRWLDRTTIELQSKDKRFSLFAKFNEATAGRVDRRG